MIRILASLAAALAGCTAPPQEAAMHRANQTPESAQSPQAAATGPSAEPVAAAANPLPVQSADSPAAAKGRRILSTAFVRVGPGGSVAVTLHNGRMLLLRDVVMRGDDYCGAHAVGGARFCGAYADIAAAQPVDAPALPASDLAAPNPLRADGSSSKAE